MLFEPIYTLGIHNILCQWVLKFNYVSQEKYFLLFVLNLFPGNFILFCIVFVLWETVNSSSLLSFLCLSCILHASLNSPVFVSFPYWVVLVYLISQQVKTFKIPMIFFCTVVIFWVESECLIFIWLFTVFIILFFSFLLWSLLKSEKNILRRTFHNLYFHYCISNAFLNSDLIFNKLWFVFIHDLYEFAFT